MTVDPPGRDDPTGTAAPGSQVPNSLMPGNARITAPTGSGFHAALPHRHPVEAHPTGKRLGILSLTALGIVYGDIGTSPLYAIRQCFDKSEYGLAVSTGN